MYRNLGLFSLLLIVLFLSSCQTSSVDIPAMGQEPVREIPMNVLTEVVAPLALTPLAVDIESGNLFDNSGFESGLAGWGACDAAAIQVSSDAYEGTSALQINAGKCFYRSVEVSPGQDLILSCYAKILSGSAWTGMGLGFADTSWTTIDGGQSAIITGNSYQRYDVEVTAPVGSKYASMWLYSDNPTVVDNCTLMLEIEPPEPEATSGNLLDNSGFYHVYPDQQNIPYDWSAGCGGTVIRAPNNYIGNPITVYIKDGACLDQSLSAADISALKGNDFTFACKVNNTSSYASMSIFLDGVSSSIVIPTSNEFETVEVKGTASSDISSGFVSLYAEGSILVVESCSLTIDGSGPPPAPPSSNDNFIENGNFESLDTNNKPNNWIKGCGGTWTSIAGRSDKGLELQGGVCIDQPLSSNTLSDLSGKDFTYSCYAKNTGGYASMTTYLNGQAESVVIPTSNSYQLVELTRTAPQLNTGFISIYSEADLTIDDCKIEVDNTISIEAGIQVWDDQFHSDRELINYARDSVRAVALSSSGVYAVGNLIESVDLGIKSLLSIRKYHHDGSIIFSNSEDLSGPIIGAATDTNDNLYVLLSPRSAVPTSSSTGQLDLWLHKYSPSGTKLFEKNIVSTQYRQYPRYNGDSSVLYFNKMVIASNAIYISGKSDETVYKFNLEGEEQWAATISDYSKVGGLAATSEGSVYITTSYTTIDNSTETTKLTKLNSDGTQAWERNIDNYLTTHLAADNTHVYVMGQTRNTFANENSDRYGYDGYLWKYDSAGNQIWTSQIATNHLDRLASAAIHNGELYITGETEYTSTTGFIKKINPQTAVEEWSIGLYSRLFNDIQVDSTGIYAGGSATRIYRGNNGTGYPITRSDAFITKYSLP